MGLIKFDNLLLKRSIQLTIVALILINCNDVHAFIASPPLSILLALTLVERQITFFISFFAAILFEGFILHRIFELELRHSMHFTGNGEIHFYVIINSIFINW